MNRSQKRNVKFNEDIYELGQQWPINNEMKMKPSVKMKIRRQPHTEAIKEIKPAPNY